MVFYYKEVRWKITSKVMSILKDTLWMHIKAIKQQWNWEMCSMCTHLYLQLACPLRSSLGATEPPGFYEHGRRWWSKQWTAHIIYCCVNHPEECLWFPSTTEVSRANNKPIDQSRKPNTAIRRILVWLSWCLHIPSKQTQQMSQAKMPERKDSLPGAITLPSS